MVTINISTKANLTNGTRGVITYIILDHWESVEAHEVQNGLVTLIYPPEMIVFKPLVSSFPKFDGLVEGKIPLFPAEHTFKNKMSANQKVLVNHRQYNLTSGYAFMIHKAQGQTLGSIFVDIQKPPHPVNMDTFRNHHILLIWIHSEHSGFKK